jgi:hypothetical protein
MTYTSKSSAQTHPTDKPTTSSSETAHVAHFFQNKRFLDPKFPANIFKQSKIFEQTNIHPSKDKQISVSHEVCRTQYSDDKYLRDTTKLTFLFGVFGSSAQLFCFLLFVFCPKKPTKNFSPHKGLWYKYFSMRRA